MVQSALTERVQMCGRCGVHCRYISKWTVIACSVSPFISTPSPDGNHCSLIGCLLFLLHGGVNCMSGIAEMHASAGLLLKQIQVPFLAGCLLIYLRVYSRCDTTGAHLGVFKMERMYLQANWYSSVSNNSSCWPVTCSPKGPLCYVGCKLKHRL